MANKASLRITGDNLLKKLMEELPKRVIKKGLRAAISAAATPIVKKAKATAPKDSGLLKKSITKKIKTYSSGNVVAIIGANRDTVGVSKGKNQVPARYLHLVEHGHNGKHPAPAHPFLAPAYEENKGQAIDIATAKLKDVLEAEAEKLGSK